MHIVIDKRGGTMFQLLTIRLSVATSDATVITSIKTEAHNLSTAIASSETYVVNSFPAECNGSTAQRLSVSM